MPSAYNGTLTGSGDIQISVGGTQPIDMDAWVTALGPKVRFAGTPPRRTFKYVGWVQFWNSTYVAFTGQPPESVGPAFYFNQESADIVFPDWHGQTVTHFYYWIAPGCAVEVNITV